MELAELLAFLAMATHLILGGVVLYRSPRNVVNQTFAILLGLFFCWSLGEVLLLKGVLIARPVKLILTPMFLLAFFFARFTALFPKRVEQSLILGSAGRTLVLFLPTAYLLWLLWSNRLIAALEIIPGGFLISFGANEFLAKGIAVGYLLLALKNLSMGSKALTSEFQELRFRYTFAGLMLPVAAGSVFIALGRIFIQGQTIYTCGLFPALGIMMAALIAYAILRFQLMEIDILFSIGLIYTLLTIILAGGIEILQNMLQNYFDVTSLWSTIVSSLVVAAVFAPLKDLIVGIVDRLFGKKVLDGPAVMRRIKDSVRGQESAGKVLETLLNHCLDLFELSAAAIVMKTGQTAVVPALPVAAPSAPLAHKVEATKEEGLLPKDGALQSDSSPAPAGNDGIQAVPQTLAPLPTLPVLPSLPAFPALPALPELWPSVTDLDALIEAGSAAAGVEVLPFEHWRQAGYRFAFPINRRQAVEGGLFVTPRPGRLPFSTQERDLLAGICLEIPTILENVSLLGALIERDRDKRDVEWASLMYLQIQADQRIREFQRREVRLFSSLAKQIKGDLIDLCADTPVPFLAICDAFHSGIPAALTLYILRTALRTAPIDQRALAVHQVLREFSDPPLRSALTLVSFAPSGNIQILNAGNIPPLLIGPGHVCKFLTEVGRPLGLEEGGESFTCTEHSDSPAGDVKRDGAPVPRASASRIELEIPPGHFLLCATNGLAKTFGDSQGVKLAEYLAARSWKNLDECHEELQKALAQLPGRSEFPDDITYVLLGGIR